MSGIGRHRTYTKRRATEQGIAAYRKELNMKRLLWLIAVPGFLSAVCSAQTEQMASRQIAPRTEPHAIQTLTVSDEQFLKGDARVKPVTITGQFRIAQGVGRLPVVVLQHG